MKLSLSAALLCAGYAGAFTGPLNAPFTIRTTNGSTFQTTSIQQFDIKSIRAEKTILQMANEEVELVTDDARERMQKSIESVKKNLTTIRTGRASTSMLDRVVVDYYGAPTPLSQMASIAVSSAQQLTVDPYDKSVIGDVERALMESDLGLTPNNDGTMIRINIPGLTEDRRKEMLKLCKSIGEDGKVAVRNVRRDGVDAIKKMEKNSEIGKDESLDGLDEMQKFTDDSVKEIDSLVSAKEGEVMKV